jgi:radical SAM protein with 4Fe4S-binding SPASM domain
MDYDCKGKKYWEDKLKENKCALIRYSNNILYAIHKNINLIQINLDWPKHHFLENRGGTFKPEDFPKEYKWLNECVERDFPCVEPAYYINIYHDGNVTPCCHIRPDNYNHKEFILGNIYEDSIVDIFYGKKASDFRKVMTSINYSNYFAPCKNC